MFFSSFYSSRGEGGPDIQSKTNEADIPGIEKRKLIVDSAQSKGRISKRLQDVLLFVLCVVLDERKEKLLAHQASPKVYVDWKKAVCSMQNYICRFLWSFAMVTQERARTLEKSSRDVRERKEENGEAFLWGSA